jgi:hypothetical protein
LHHEQQQTNMSKVVKSYAVVAESAHGDIVYTHINKVGEGQQPALTVVGERSADAYANAQAAILADRSPNAVTLGYDTDRINTPYARIETPSDLDPSRNVAYLRLGQGAWTAFVPLTRANIEDIIGQLCAVLNNTKNA